MYCCLFVLLLTLVSTCSGFKCSNVRVITRTEWHAASPAREEIKPKAGRVFVHHTNTPECDDIGDCIASVKEVENFHRNILGNNDMDTHFYIGGDGYVYEGVGWNARGNHTPGYPNDLGVAFIGEFEEDPASDKMINAFKALVACGAINGKIELFYSIYGHKDARCSTSCPGSYLYSQLKKLPKFQLGGKLEMSCDD